MTAATDDAAVVRRVLMDVVDAVAVRLVVIDGAAAGGEDSSGVGVLSTIGAAAMVLMCCEGVSSCVISPCFRFWPEAASERRLEERVERCAGV